MWWTRVFPQSHFKPALVAQYDVHGRAVLMDPEDVMCDLVLAEMVADTVHVEFRPAPGEVASN